MGRNPRRLFLVYVATILRYEPIFTQLLSFIFRSAGAVEQLAVQRAIGVTNFWHTVLILKFCVAFRHRASDIAAPFLVSSFPSSCVRHTTHLFYHEHWSYAIDACTKKRLRFLERVCIDTFKSVRKERAACTGTVQIRKGLGFPNKHFATQNFAFVRTNALLASSAYPFGPSIQNSSLSCAVRL